MRSARAITLLETLAIASIFGVLASLAVIPAYRSYESSRAAADAAQTLAQDISLAEREAQDGGADQGATLLITSAHPLSYEVLRGRPNALDPRSTLGQVIASRAFSNAALTGGPISPATPLLFAENGSAQYRAEGEWSDQHQTLELVVGGTPDEQRTARVDVDLFTGAVSVP